MNEIQVYRFLYGEMVECVPHYQFRIRCEKAKLNPKPKPFEFKEMMKP